MTYRKRFSDTLPAILNLRNDPELIPINGMEETGLNGEEKNGFAWRAHDEDACFLVSGKLPKRGFNMLEIEIEHDKLAAATGITFDVGDGFSSENTIYLAVRGGRIAKRICRIPRGLKRIRIQPLVGETGEFSIKRMRFVWLTPRFTCSRMLRRLNFADRFFQGEETEQIKLALKNEARNEGIGWKQLMAVYYERTFAYGAPTFSYALWQEQVEQPREPSREHAIAAIAKFNVSVRFGVMLTEDHVDSRELSSTLDSLLGQHYAEWYLLVTARQYSNKKFRQTLTKYEESHAGLAKHLIIQPPDSKAISHWVFSAHEKLDYLLFLSSGDVLAPNATYHLANHYQRHRDALLIYGDEDRLEHRERKLPNFKPGWNPDLLLSANYIGRGAAFSVDHLETLPGWIDSVAELDLHGLALAFTETLDSSQINRVAHILLHRSWRDRDSYEELTANGPGYSLRAVRDSITRTGANASVSEEVGVGCRVKWDVPEPAPLVSLLIPTRDMVHMLKPCVNKILELTDYPNFEIIILDNQSTDSETLAYLKHIQQYDSRVRVLRWDHAFNYSSINNFGVEHATGDIIGLVNNDVEPIDSEWLKEMVGHVVRPDVGCVGAKLYYPNDTVQHGGVILGLGGIAGHAHRFYPREAGGFQNRLLLTHNLSAVTAACLLVRREVFIEAGGLEEKFLPVAYNDVDLCIKVRELGYRNVWTPYSELYHHESVSRGIDDNPVKKARAKREVDYLCSRWKKELLDDPAYNPNLSIGYEDFSLR